MRHSLHSHIIYLENTIQSLTDRLTLPRLSEEETQALEMQLAMAERALARYREAYALEVSVASSDPPQGSDSSSDGASDAKHSPSRKRGDGGAAIRLRSRVGMGRLSASRVHWPGGRALTRVG